MQQLQRLNSYLFQTLFTEGTLGRVVQAALQAVFTEGVATGCSHRLVKQPVVITEMQLLTTSVNWDLFCSII